MRTCGVEIKGSEAVISLLSLDDGLFQILDCRARKVMLEGGTGSESLKRFQFTFAKLMADYKIEKVVIRERPTKGKFAGGAPGFKIEAAIQLIDDLDVELISATKIKESLKKNPLQISLSEAGLKVFQEGAFNTAYAFLMMQMYPSLAAEETPAVSLKSEKAEPVESEQTADKPLKEKKKQKDKTPSPWG
ncbi:DUF3010 family protein [Alteromonadaceae bacterium M269]|nr:DUF3010 family protein [Alteromonadaceae bacterium M269]